MTWRVAVLAGVAAAGYLADPPAPVVAPVDAAAPVCDSVDGSTLVAEARTPEARAATRAEARRTCEALGVAADLCDALDAVIVRESDGVASVRHTQGPREVGLGPAGLSLRWHAAKWGDDADPWFCSPHVSALVVLEIWRRAIVRYHATDLVELQAVFAGRWHVDADGRAWALHDRRRDTDWCHRLADYGVDCRRKVGRRDLGRAAKITTAKQRREAAEEMETDGEG